MNYLFKEDIDGFKVGSTLIREGKCGCIVLAGGIGSRLRFDKPKGCFPVTIIKKKSLFQLLAEKVKAANVAFEKELFIAIMTSPLNHTETREFFELNSFFGLKSTQIDFFQQKMWPLEDFKGGPFYDDEGKILYGPNGNGGVFNRFLDEGILEKWEKNGIQIINLIPIDNPLANPFDPTLFATHKIFESEVTIKSAFRKNPSEKVGILVKRENKITIIEYSELEASLQHQEPLLANLGLYCFSMDFVKKIAPISLPIHKAKKASIGRKADHWKCEQFVFDVLEYASGVRILVYPREECFAPLKNFEGEDSIGDVQKALQVADRNAFSQVTGTVAKNDQVFELALDFYYPHDSLIHKWKGKTLPNQPYIEA